MAAVTPNSRTKQSLPTVGVFFSPPDLALDSFSHTLSPLGHSHAHPADNKLQLPSIDALLSPPVSPHTAVENDFGRRELHDGLQDPELFPERVAGPDSYHSQPLFHHNKHDELIEQHLALRQQVEPPARIPTKAEYALAASFVTKVVDRYNANPQAYIRQELEFLNLYRTPASETVNTALETAGVKRRAGEYSLPAKRQRVAKAHTTMPTLPRTKRQPRTSPREDRFDSFDIAQYSPEAKAPRATPHRDDTDYSVLPDYTPSMATLSNNGKALKTEWRGHPLDLNNDPDRHMLHEAEVGLASTLRLTCAQYLCSKRRIFASRLESQRAGKEFRKTTAQQACKIDVNKASKLWTAFDKVGWFESRYMARYL